MSLLLLDDSSSGLFPPETGPLHIVGTHFYKADGSLAQIRDKSMFLLFLRYCRGEDITPELRWMRAFGFNSARVFGPLPSPPWNLPDYGVLQFDFVKFDAFLGMLERFGIFCNFSIGHEPWNGWKNFEAKINEIARAHWCVLTEKVNEPQVGDKPDPISDFLPYTQGGLPPTAYGYYQELLGGPMVIPPIAAFGTVHTPRRDAAWARKFRIAQEAQDKSGIPWWNNEPAKLTEPDFHYVGGKNDPQNTPREIAEYLGGCYLWCSAGTFHDEEGKWGRVPQPGMLQYEDAESVRDNVFLKIGPEWQTGEYNNSENNDSPVDDVDLNGRPLWTYTSLHEHKALSIRFGTVPLKAINGWRIVESWGPKNAPDTFAKLER